MTAEEHLVKIREARDALKNNPHPDQHQFGCAELNYYYTTCNCGYTEKQLNHVTAKNELNHLIDIIV